MNENLNFFYKMLNEYYDEKTVKKIIEGLNKKKVTTLRVNTLKSNIDEIRKEFDKNNIKYSGVSWYDKAFIIENAKEELKRLDIYEQGKIYLQSLSSMIPPIVLNPKEEENILDMAAAPRRKDDSNDCSI